MLVSHKHKFIFLKTRKTAGTSIEMALQPLCTFDTGPVTEKTHAIVSDAGIVGQRLTLNNEKTIQDKIWRNHMPAKQIKRGVGNKLWQSCLIVSAVRNPFDRMVSAYHWAMATKNIVPSDDFSTLKASFREFVLSKDAMVDRNVVFINGRFVPQYLIRFEHMQEDLHNLMDKLGVENFTPELPLTKSTAKQRKKIPVADYYDAETIAHVKKRMSWAFKHSDYPDTPNEPR